MNDDQIRPFACRSPGRLGRPARPAGPQPASAGWTSCWASAGARACRLGRRRIRFGVGSPGTDTTASPSSSGPRSRNAISSHSPGGVKARSGSRSSAVADYTLQPPCCGCRPQRLVLQGQLADLALGLLERPIIRRPSGRWPLRPWRPCLAGGAGGHLATRPGDAARPSPRRSAPPTIRRAAVAARRRSSYWPTLLADPGAAAPCGPPVRRAELAQRQPPRALSGCRWANPPVPGRLGPWGSSVPRGTPTAFPSLARESLVLRPEGRLTSPP